ncbi:MAG: hypothetical protein RLY78_1556 [Pseudomonadota bacterium]|jgi:hypothetical protein
MSDARPDAQGGPVAPRASQQRRRRPVSPSARILSFDQARIERALPGRARYRYVHPWVVAVDARAGGGWKIVSPNCSRNVDPEGGEIDIAWFEPVADGRWNLHARDHAGRCWTLRAQGLPLADALALVCEDRGRDYWQ